MIVYLASTTGAIAACESLATVSRCEARGYVQVSGAIHRALWKRKVREAVARMVEEAGGGKVREVGGWEETIIRRGT